MLKHEKQNDASDTVAVSELLEISGKYQALQYFFICLPPIFVSMMNVNFIFVAGEVNYRCKIPECDINSTYDVPWWPNTHIDQCTKPMLNTTLSDICSNNSFTLATEECTEWIYESYETVVPQLNLACQPWKRNFIGVIHTIGMGCAMVLGGWMADNYGRKTTLIICAVGCTVGNFKTLAPSYPVYICLEFLESLIVGGAYTAGSVLMIEIGNKKNRMLSGVLFAYGVYMGEAVFAIVAMFVPYWKPLLHIICSPPILFLIYIIVVEESPRWLILKGKLTRAKNTLKQMIKANKIKVNIEELDSMDENKLKEAYDIGAYEIKEGFKDVLRCREVLKRFLVAFECRFAVTFIYYGLLTNSVSLPGDKFVNFLIAAIMSFPGELISMFMMNKFGRRLPLIYGYLLCGAFCVAYGLVPESYTALKITFFLVGKLLTSACYTGIAIYTMELFPTSVRGLLLGLCNFALCVGNLLAILTPMLASVSSIAAPICFGCAGIISGALIILTPETTNLPLLDTIEQMTRPNNNTINKKED